MCLGLQAMHRSPPECTERNTFEDLCQCWSLPCAVRCKDSPSVHCNQAQQQSQDSASALPWFPYFRGTNSDYLATQILTIEAPGAIGSTLHRHSPALFSVHGKLSESSMPSRSRGGQYVGALHFRGGTYLKTSTTGIGTLLSSFERY